MKRWNRLCFGFLFGLLALAPMRAEAFCERSYVFLLLDVSGSMVDATNPTRHTIVRNAIKDVTLNFNTQVDFGLATFGEQYRLRIAIGPTAWSTIRTTIDGPPGIPSNEGYTRMATGIRAAGQYLWGLKQTEPAATRQRPYYLVVITDGDPNGESLSVSTETQTLWQSYGIKTYAIGVRFNAAVLQSIASQGQTGQPYNAANQTEVNNAFTQIANTASTEICDGLDNDCDGQADEGLTRACAASCGPGIQTCQAGQWSGCSGTTPQTETCNNKDDDCDGRIDENLFRPCSTACGTGTETCVNGSYRNCNAPQPQIEACDGIDNNCNGQVDETWPNKGQICSSGQGICQRSGVWVCNAAQTGVECSAAPGPPQTEICDDKDNDCDGQIDEDWSNKGQTCSSGAGACQRAGQFVCKPDGSGTQCSAGQANPTPEVCDGLDNDCNGLIDDTLTRSCTTACGQGIETCQGGRWGGCTARQPTTEVCNGIDDDCDGQIDNAVPGRPCSTICGQGTESCNNGRWEKCSAQTPEAETCDGKDNDCNGAVDDIPPKACSGACGSGTAACVNGQWSGCSGPAPEPEVCDGKDNDCDGQIDNGVTRACSTDCGQGIETCRQGQWFDCSAPIPQPELCDGKDNDCNGKADDGAPCPQGLICVSGACRQNCRGGECPRGFQCVQDVCIGDACANVQCPANQQCVGGKCTDLCTLVTCPADLTCSRGQCIRQDCYVIGCPDGQRCINAKCESDPCVGKTCGPTAFCREGQCVSSCLNVTCPADERCADGKCEKDPTKSGPCAGTKCPAGQKCENGQCIADLCFGVSCAVGRTCKDGQCDHDACHNIKCPVGSVCKDGQCQTSSKPGEPNPNEPSPREPGSDEPIPSTEKDTDGGDTEGKNIGTGKEGDTERKIGRSPGCACSASDPLSNLPIALLFGFLLLAIRRRA